MNNVLTLRNSLKMTQDEFAEYCNVSRISIARYEAEGKISRAGAEKIAAACGVTVSYVLGETIKPVDEETEDIMKIRQLIRSDPSYRTLFDTASRSNPEHVRAAAEMLKALGPKDEFE